MLFHELRFFLFFAVVFCGAWALRGDRPRKLWLLVASYVFYAAWDWRFVSLILVSTAIDYTAALRIARGDARSRRGWVTASLVGNLGILGFFKYFDFFVESAAELLVWAGFRPHLETLGLVLPVGISFYTFQSLSYTIDVYRGQLEARRSLLDVSLYVGFFPQLVAGPIVRASQFLPQLGTRPRWDEVDVRRFVALFWIGFFKKVFVADGLATRLDPYFAEPAAWDAASAWILAPFYAVQIYCDFSGYSDMAIATAGLLGYRIPRNFDFPYFARDVAEFWRRWHISLSTWLRDYLYIPLGGNRATLAATLRNLMLTMLLGGLWHGAAWSFILWGAMHGTALCLHRAWRARGAAGAPSKMPACLSLPLTFLWVVLGWVVFRAESLADVGGIWRAMLLLDSPGTRAADPALVLLWLPLALLHWAAWRRLGERTWRALPAWAAGALLGACVAAGLWLFPVEFQPFIYFQF